MEKSYASYSKFFFTKSKALADSYIISIDIINRSKDELESAITRLCNYIKNHLCSIITADVNAALAEILHNEYANNWSFKRQKAFDYYTNAFMEYISNIVLDSSDQEIISKLAKSLMGIELAYWSDKHIDDFESRVGDIISKLNNYVVGVSLQGNETKVTLTPASGREKSVVFDYTGLSDLSVTLKNKINSTFNNFGLSVSYNDKVQVLLSILDDLLEGK